MQHRKLLATLGTTPKDRWSSIAGIVIFAGGAFVTLANAGLLPDRWRGLGEAMVAIGGSAVAMLTGRDPQDIAKSQTLP